MAYCPVLGSTLLYLANSYAGMSTGYTYPLSKNRLIALLKSQFVSARNFSAVSDLQFVNYLKFFTN